MKKPLTGLLALCAALLLATSALAAGPRDEFFVDSLELEEERLTVLPDGDEGKAGADDLFSGYVSQRLYGLDGAVPLSLRDPARERLSDKSKLLYDLLKDRIVKTAESGGSSLYTITSQDLGVKTSWTEAELRAVGLAPPTSKEGLRELVSAVRAREEDGLDEQTVLNALLADCPYELYWFNKTRKDDKGGFASGMSLYDTSYSSSSGLSFKLQHYYRFSVAEGYQASNSTEEAPVVRGDVASVKTAVKNAAAIVAKCHNLPDDQKLLAYKAEICDNVDYNYEAAAGGTAYGDPWQLIWVFDNDDSTKVVCEGYSKAFQYLCDLSEFNDVDCYTVSGLMQGGTGGGLDGTPGPHMWNIVRIGGKSYLVDVTNSDTKDGGLFLVGAIPYTQTDPAGYDVALGNRHLYYWYGELYSSSKDAPPVMIPNEMLDVWGGGVLALSDTSYSPGGSDNPDTPDTPDTPDENAIGQVERTGNKLQIRSGVTQPAWLLAAAYGQGEQLVGIIPVRLNAAGFYTNAFDLPDETQSFKVLLAGGESWVPLCGARTA